MKEYKVLKTSEEHQGALAEAERLVLLDPSVGSKEADRLELLSLLIEDYEDRSFVFEERSARKLKKKFPSSMISTSGRSVAST